MSSEHLWFKQRLRLGMTIHWICVVIYFVILVFRRLYIGLATSGLFWALGLSFVFAGIIKEFMLRQDEAVIKRYYWIFSLLDTFIISFAYYQSYPSNFVVFPFYLLIILKSTIEIVPGEMRTAAVFCFLGLTIDQVFLWPQYVDYLRNHDWTSLQGIIALFAPVFYLSMILFFAMIAQKVRAIRQEMTDRLNRALQEKDDNLAQLISAHVTLEEKYVESYTLNLVQESIFQQLDRIRILENASDILMGVLGGKSCSIYMNLPKEETLRLTVSVGVLDEECFRSSYLTKDTALIPVTWRQEKVGDENAMELNERELLRNHGVSSVLCVPLTGQDHMWGVILLTHALDNAFPQERRSLVQLIARQLGLALDNARLHQEMKELATHDPLTGLYNRHFLNNHINGLDEQLRDGTLKHLSCVIMDIDYFKRINDTYGHLYGDLILQQVTDVIQRVATEEIIARYGGEEFIILSSDEERSMVQLAETLRSETAKLSFGSAKKGFIPVTISCGVASIPEHARNATELVGLADVALYQAKRNGRNRTESYLPVISNESIKETSA